MTTINHSGRRPMRRGFTIIELIVAIMILSIGVLGLASTSALILRMVGGGARQSTVANVAASRFESLRATPCAQIVSGQYTDNGISERWIATPVLRGALTVAIDINLIVTYTISKTNVGGIKTRTQQYRSYIQC